ncbi:MAG: hypothetical protein ACREQY_19335, partial [Candidatus Binatia bacterium]
MRGERLLATLLALCVLAGCGIGTLTRPEGDGGWSPQVRGEELSRIAKAAGIDLLAADPLRPAPRR